MTLNSGRSTSLSCNSLKWKEDLAGKSTTVQVGSTGKSTCNNLRMYQVLIGAYLEYFMMYLIV